MHKKKTMNISKFNDILMNYSIDHYALSVLTKSLLISIGLSRAYPLPLRYLFQYLISFGVIIK